MEDVLNQVFSIGARIRESGLGTQWLWFIGLLFTVTLVLSVREVAQWYLGVYRLRSELKEIRETLLRIQGQLAGHSSFEKVHELSFMDGAPNDKIMFEVPKTKPAEKFPLQR
jgi:hypothetical protein